MIGTTAALLGSAAISGGASLLGGIFGKKAATSAAKLQAAAAEKAAQEVRDTTATVNPQILEAAKRAGLSATEAAKVASEGVNTATGEANKLLNPYLESGGKANELLSGELDSTGKIPTLEELQMDPGYAFRVAEGTKALQSRGAALGLATSGGAAKAAIKYQQAEASQEYQAAFERFRTTNADRFNRLLSVSQQGQQAAGTSGGNLINAGRYTGDTGLAATEYAGNLDVNATTETGRNTIDASRISADYGTQGANAIAAGKVGGTNALMGGISGATNALTSAATLSALLKNPAGGYVNRLKLRNPTVDLGVGA